MRINNKLLFFLVLVISFVVHFFATAKYGLAIFPDSINYVHSAKTLLNQGGMFQFTGEYFVSWPPLYSIFIAIFVIPFSDSAIPNMSFIHGFIYAFSCGIMFKILSDDKNSTRSNIFAFLLSLTIWPIASLSFEIVSENLFILLSLSAFYFAFKKDNFTLALVFISLAILQRYIGFVWFFAIVLIGFIKSEQKQKWIFKSVIAFLPLVFWIGRNYYFTQTFTGVRSDSFISLYDNLILGIDVISKWIFPHFLPIVIRLTLILLIFLLILFQLKSKPKNALFLASFGFFLIYFLSIWIISTSGASEALSFRLLAPAVPFFMISLWFGLDVFQAKFSYAKPLVLAFIIGFQSIFLLRLVIDKYKFGTGGFSHDDWKNSQILAWYQSSGRSFNYFGSNASDAVYARTGDVIPISPFRYQSEIADSLVNKGSYLIWFNRTNRRTLIPLDSLVNRFNLVKTEDFNDGSVWKKSPSELHK